MASYEESVLRQLSIWQRKMEKKPSLTSRITKGLQKRINSLVPEKVHVVVTAAIKNMVKVVLFGSEYTTPRRLLHMSLEQREKLVKEKENFYKKSATLSGAGTGAGGILLGLADFPILIGLKMKFLFDTASLYGFDVGNYRERLFILYVFQMAFSSEERGREVYRYILNWDNHMKSLPEDIESFDWRTFQQEYRDYIDLAKLLQLVPGIGAIVGAYANYKLMSKLGETAMYAYRLRLLGTQAKQNWT
mgnify:CR=1 FL=1